MSAGRRSSDGVLRTRETVPPAVSAAVSDCAPPPTRGVTLGRLQHHHLPFRHTPDARVKSILDSTGHLDSGYLSQAYSTDESGLLSGPADSLSLTKQRDQTPSAGADDQLSAQLKHSLSLNTEDLSEPERRDLEHRYLTTLDEAFSGDEDGDTHLHLAIIYGFRKVAECLIRLVPHASLLSLRNTYLQTPLHLAVLMGDARLARHLLVAGVDPSCRDRHGNTPLHLACQQADRECAYALTEPVTVQETRQANLRYQAQPAGPELPAVDQWNYQGLSCLHLATLSGDLQIVAHLICHGADVNIMEGKSGRTPLHLAVESGNIETLRFLVEACGANVDAVTYGNLSSYQMALLNARLDLAELLLQLGARRADLPDSDMETSSDSDTEPLVKPEELYTDLRIGGRPLAVA